MAVGRSTRAVPAASASGATSTPSPTSHRSGTEPAFRCISHEPSEDCFNAYVTKRIVDRYRAWMRAEAARLRLPTIDLTQTLLPRNFLDTLHPNARGERKVAGALSPHLVPVLRERAAEVLPARPH